MANILPEVQPVVTSMPDKGYELQTGGSARRSFIKNTEDTYYIHGVPGHTHNASLGHRRVHSQARNRPNDW